MAQKQKGIINSVTVNGATFTSSPVAIEPTLINFFFGQNGTGKTTVAEALNKEGLSKSGYEVRLFNQDYVSDNMSKVKGGSGLGAVFVLDEENKKINEEIGKLTKKIDREKAGIQTLEETAEKSKKEKQKEIDKVVKVIWDETDAIRRKYGGTFLVNHRNKIPFLDEIKAAAPLEIELEKVEAFYHDSFENKTVEEFPILSIRGLPSFDEALLKEPIVNSSSGQFKEFISRMGAEGWFREAYEQFRNNEMIKGFCPYCHQKLPEDFDSEVAKAFDDTYTNAIRKLVKSHDEYVDDAKDFVAQGQALLSEKWADEDSKNGFEKALKAIEAILENNNQRIYKKIHDPAWRIELVSPGGSFSDLLSCIKKNNDVARSKNRLKSNPELAKAEGRKMLCGFLHFKYQEQFNAIAAIEGEIKGINDSLAQGKNEINQRIAGINKEIEDKKALAKDTSSIVDDINKLICNSGFTGFHLEEIDEKEHTIQIIRDSTGKPAIKLSEGEKNFIMFLYFYYSVKGTFTNDGIRNPKIVIIDDPITSMDNQALFFVASLIKELIGICANNYEPDTGTTRDDYIKQFFLLTHNPFFFRQIADKWLNPYEHVTFYSVTKSNNVSKIRVCQVQSKTTPVDYMNDLPVKNAYDAIWSQYRAAEDPSSLLSACRLIIQNFFIETCSMDPGDLENKLLVENKDDLTHNDETGAEDSTEYNIVQTMISYLRANMFDDYNYDISSIPMQTIRDSFKKIFFYMGHIKHYEEMAK